MERVLLPGLSAEAFISDTDRKAMEALRRVPLLPKVVQKFYEVGLDRWLYCWNMAMSVRCGPSQYPTIHRVTQECARVLDMAEPEVYITSNPFPNAFAGGVERPYVVIRSSMIETLSDEGLYHLIGHELGHIKCGHLLYSTVARVLMPLMEMLGRRTLGIGDAVSIGLVMAFMEWSRQAEISADRAGLLCTQDFMTSARANLGLCAGPSRLQHEGDVDAFLDQARTYQDLDALDSVGKMMVFLFYGSLASHPMPVHRTQELERWAKGGALERILAGNYAKRG